MIIQNINGILSGLPKGVELVAATKTRTIEEILQAIKAGVKIVGENYVQEAESKFLKIGNKVKWHLIGHLQSNKVKKAVKIFDCIETVDSIDLAKMIDKECAKINKNIEVMIEVNSGREPQKSGSMPEDVLALAREIVILKNVKLIGLMTMGFAQGGDELKEQFMVTKQIFDKINDTIPLSYLSMGMSGSYKLAITQGANLVRLGTIIFGAR